MKRLIVISLLLLSQVVFSEEKYPYHAISIGYGGSWDILRFQKENGKAWFVRNGSYVQIVDEEELPIGNYEFSTSTTHNFSISKNPVKSNWQLIRINTNTGETWWAEETTWIKVKD